MTSSLLLTICCSSSSSFSCVSVGRRYSSVLLRSLPTPFASVSPTICMPLSCECQKRPVHTKMAPAVEAQNFVAFMNKSPSPFHAVAECKDLLIGAGFTELKESDSWSVKLGGRHFVKKNESTIIAFAVGKKFRPGNGFSIVGAHTDSPCLRVKPVSKKKEKDGYIQVGVECYGGGIWHTWFDRDLKIAGRVLVKTADGKLQHRLVHIDRPIMRIPNLAIHLDRTTNEKFSPNKETHLCPVLATVAMEELSNSDSGAASPDASGVKNQASKHHPILVKLICDQLAINTDQLMDFELCLADASPAVIGGAFEEFIFSPRLDNLVNAYTSTVGLIRSLEGASLDEEENVRMISLFDNEEVGSQSAQGAESMFQEHVLRRLTSSGFGLSEARPNDAFETAVRRCTKESSSSSMPIKDTPPPLSLLPSLDKSQTALASHCKILSFETILHAVPPSVPSCRRVSGWPPSISELLSCPCIRLEKWDALPQSRIASICTPHSSKIIPPSLKTWSIELDKDLANGAFEGGGAPGVDF